VPEYAYSANRLEDEMPDCFISYSSQDQRIADFVYSELTRQHLDVFMASVSLRPGENWSESVRANLKASSWVIFLASRVACKSAYVLQETGMALGTGKQIVPIVWDIVPSQLPGWLNRTQALDVRNLTLDQIRTRISQIAESIRQNKNQGVLIVGALIFALCYFSDRQ
jgi:TIR domain